MAHLHPVYDDDPHFIIDPDLREIIYDSESELILIQGDHNSERFTFELPRYIDNHDMSLCNKVRVHYINLNSDNPDVREQGVYEVDDIQVCPDDEDNTVVCSWLVSKNATVYVGSLSFVVSFACVTGSQLDYSWNTGIYSGVIIQKGINNGEFITVTYADVLEEWHQKLIEDSVTGVNAILEAQNTALDIIDSAYTEELEAGRRQLIEGSEIGINAINEARNEAIESIGAHGGIAVSENEPSAESVVAWLQDLPEDQQESVELFTKDDLDTAIRTYVNEAILGGEY